MERLIKDVQDGIVELEKVKHKHKTMPTQSLIDLLKRVNGRLVTLFDKQKEFGTIFDE